MAMKKYREFLLLALWLTGLVEGQTPVPTPSPVTTTEPPTEPVSMEPTEPVTMEATEPPTETVSMAPTERVTTAPTWSPTEKASMAPTETVTTALTETFSAAPTETVSTAPTETVSAAPTDAVSAAPTAVSATPTDTVSAAPTDTTAPSEPATISPAPSQNPTPSPTQNPDFPTFNKYFSDPLVKWTVQLGDTGMPNQSRIDSGNAVTVSPENTLVYVTLHDGRLEVLAASNGGRRWGYTPSPIGNGWKVECNSAVYFGDLPGVGRYAIYAVIDVPPAGSGQLPQSRIISVAHPNNRVLWMSEAIPGQVQGTPVISQARGISGQYIFFTHNENFDPFGSDIVGIFSIVKAFDGSLIFSEIAGDSEFDPSTDDTRIESLRQPYGPVGVAHDPLAGRYQGGFMNMNDVIIWSTNVEEGVGGNGYTRAFQIPRLFSSEFAANLVTTFLREVRWNAIAPPELSPDGTYLFFGMQSNSVRGWTGVPDFDQNANLVYTLAEDPDERRTPLPNKPVLSVGGTRLFAASSAAFVYGLSPETSDVRWTRESDSAFTGTINVSPDDYLLYTTQENGRVTARRQIGGAELWEIDCSDIPSEDGVNCVDSLQGDFSLSPNGLVLYYGDQLGNVKALQIAESGIDTRAPTEFPTGTPSTAPSDTEPPTDVPSEMPSTSGSKEPTGTPSSSVSSTPTVDPTDAPTDMPVMDQTDSQTDAPTDAPTEEVDSASMRRKLSWPITGILFSTLVLLKH